MPETIRFEENNWRSQQLRTEALATEANLNLVNVEARPHAIHDRVAELHEELSQKYLKHELGFIECDARANVPVITIPANLRSDQQHILVGESEQEYDANRLRRVSERLTTRWQDRSGLLIRAQIQIKHANSSGGIHETANLVVDSAKNPYLKEYIPSFGNPVTLRSELTSAGSPRVIIECNLNDENSAPPALKRINELAQAVLVRRIGRIPKDNKAGMYQRHVRNFKIVHVIYPRNFDIKVTIDQRGVHCSIAHWYRKDGQLVETTIPVDEDETGMDRVVEELVSYLESAVPHLEEVASQGGRIKSAELPYTGTFANVRVTREIRTVGDISGARILAKRYLDEQTQRRIQIVKDRLTIDDLALELDSASEAEPDQNFESLAERALVELRAQKKEIEAQLVELDDQIGHFERRLRQDFIGESRRHEDLALLARLESAEQDVQAFIDEQDGKFLDVPPTAEVEGYPV